MMMERYNRNTQSGHVVTLERGLLAGILAMQLIIAWGVFKPDAMKQGNAETPAPVSTVTPMPSASCPIFPDRHVFDDMDALFADAFENMTRLRSAMHIDEGWDRLCASPTMDMRYNDADYLVSFSIPGALPKDIEVLLDGRVLTIQAVAPVRGPFATRMQRFERRVLLPGPVGHSDDAHASITNGILRVHVPKGLPESPRHGRMRLF